MKKGWTLCAVALIGFVTIGMGGLGSQDTVKTPEPDRIYAATLIDQSDVSMALEKLSCNGQTYVTGEMGRAKLSIDFMKIRALQFFLEDDRIRAEIALNDGKSATVYMDKDVPWYGEASFASVRIETKDIKKIGPIEARETSAD